MNAEAWPDKSVEYIAPSQVLNADILDMAQKRAERGLPPVYAGERMRLNDPDVVAHFTKWLGRGMLDKPYVKLDTDSTSTPDL